jgi:hypothetical protein
MTRPHIHIPECRHLRLLAGLEPFELCIHQLLGWPVLEVPHVVEVAPRLSYHIRFIAGPWSQILPELGCLACQKRFLSSTRLHWEILFEYLSCSKLMERMTGTVLRPIAARAWNPRLGSSDSLRPSCEVPLPILFHHRIQIKRSPLRSYLWLEDALQGIDWVGSGAFVLRIRSASVSGVGLLVAAYCGRIAGSLTLVVIPALSTVARCGRTSGKAILRPWIPAEELLSLEYASSGTGSPMAHRIKAAAEQLLASSQTARCSVVAKSGLMTTPWVHHSSPVLLVGGGACP